MEFVDALSECWWLGESCVPRWEAWAALGGIAAAIGSLAAATATYFAVVHPHRRRLLEAQSALVAALRAFVPEMSAMLFDVERSKFILDEFNKAGDRRDVLRMLRALPLNVSFPAISPTPEHLEIVDKLNALQAVVRRWNTFIGGIPEPNDENYGYLDHLKEFLPRHFEFARNDLVSSIRDVAELIQEELPNQELRITHLLERAKEMDGSRVA
ncbi:hypothetical protein [Stenotrophomonas geniculata]|uniref:hypothetical protein n=1 Tax=Stenotrophomonas geniculata TaxID=86188 RepID=UPI002ACD8612|nr:hypothetical protein [Stenotrophomonas geniculata]